VFCCNRATDRRCCLRLGAATCSRADPPDRSRHDQDGHSFQTPTGPAMGRCTSSWASTVPAMSTSTNDVRACERSWLKAAAVR